MSGSSAHYHFTHKIVAIGLLVAVLAVTSTMPTHGADSHKPVNVVVVLVDDMGWRDSDAYGKAEYRTPNMRRMAAEGMRFTSGYAACTVCSPTRAAVMTGKYPARLHVTDWIAGHVRKNAKLTIPDWTKELILEETTIAETLQAAGYVTAHFGKWHLGAEPFYPQHQGFTLNLGGDHRGQPPSYFSPYKIPSINDGPSGEYLTDRLTDEVEKFITTNKDKPFFVYLPHYGVHTPVQAKESDIQKNLARGLKPKGPINATYVAMVESVDASLGRILDTLDTLQLSEHTLVVFTSDNGGLAAQSDCSPLRAGKGSPYEGGVRVPFIVRWPGVVPRGTICDEPVCSIDLYPTIVAATAVTDDPAHHPDGINIMPVLTQTGTLKREALYWHYPHYHPGGSTPYSAMRAGDYRLVEFFEDNHLELYNLAADIGEEHNLVASQPEQAKAMHAQLQKWRDAVGAQYATPNPNYQPQKK